MGAWSPSASDSGLVTICTTSNRACPGTGRRSSPLAVIIGGTQTDGATQTATSSRSARRREPPPRACPGRARGAARRRRGAGHRPAGQPGGRHGAQPGPPGHDVPAHRSGGEARAGAGTPGLIFAPILGALIGDIGRYLLPAGSSSGSALRWAILRAPNAAGFSAAWARSAMRVMAVPASTARPHST